MYMDMYMLSRSMHRIPYVALFLPDQSGRTIVSHCKVYA